MAKKVYYYKITNIINNKIYIGQTVSPKKRWYAHRYKVYSANKSQYQYLHHAMLKYGVENFTFEVIASSIIFDQKEIDKEEGALIQQYNSMFFANGYNIQSCGNSSNYIYEKCNANGCDRYDGYRLKGVKYCDLHLQRVKKYGTIELPIYVAYNKGIKMSEEVKKKLSSILKGRPAHNKGIPMNPAHKEKLRQLSIGREPYNKIKFTDEQIYKILNDKRGGKKIAKDFGVTYPVIKRIRLTYQVVFKDNNYKLITIK